MWECLYFCFFIFLWHVFNFKLVHAKYSHTHTYTHTHPTHSQTLSFWILNFFPHFCCLFGVIFFCSIGAYGPIEQSIGSEYYFFPLKKKRKKSESIKYVRLYRIKINVYYSFSPLSFDLWQCDIGDCDFHLQYQKNGFTINGESAGRIATAINSKQRTKSRANPSMLFINIKMHRPRREKRESGKPNIVRAQFFELLLWNNNFLKTFLFRRKHTQVNAKHHTERFWIKTGMNVVLTFFWINGRI